MDQLSQALNLGPRPMPSACSRLHRRTLKSIPRKNGLYLYGVDTLAEFSRAAKGGSEACQGRKPTLWRRTRRCVGKPNSYRQPPAFSPFQPQNRVYCPKNIFHCPKRTKSDKNKLKTNTFREWLHSEYMITSLAKKRLYVGGLAGVDATCATLAVPGAKKLFDAIALHVLQTVLKWRDKGV